MLKSKEYYMDLALKEAKLSKSNSVPIGCVIVDKTTGEIVSRANNNSILKNDPFSHAEIKALKELANKLENNYLNNYEIYITLEPCLMCFSLIKFYRLNTINFGLKNYKYGFLNFLNNSSILSKIKINSGICEKESKQLLSDFFTNLRKTKKGK